MNFADPRSNLLQLGIREGMKVGDLGAGSGHYAFSLVPLVGPTGKVYAIDIQEEVINRLENDIKQKRISNIETIWGDIEEANGTKLRDHVLDVIILSNTFFQLTQKENAIIEMKRILKPDGKLLLIDWAGSYNGIGPKETEVVTEHVAEDFFISHGFHKVRDFRGGPHHYAIIFTSP